MNAATALSAELPPWGLMWLLAGGLFVAGKAVMLRDAGLQGWRKAGFALAWPGMDPEPFHEAAGKRATAHLVLFLGPLVNVIVGGLLLWGVAGSFSHPLVAGWVGMVGLILMLHFGAFGLLAAAWRTTGVAVTPIMRCPIVATSLAEFWGRRWNLAFRDLAHRVVFTPVRRRAGPTAAVWASFVVSGLVHDLVISVPAGAGFGLSTSYFLLQALGLVLERRADRSVRLTSWLRTHAFTVLPVFVLFHPPFVERVMVPFFRVIGALP